MNKKLIISIVIISVMVLSIGGALAYSFMPKKIPTETELPDVIIIGNQKNLPEVRAFVEKYGDDNTIVDRSGRLAVDYNNVDHSMRLRVFSDDSGRPQEMYIDCPTDTNANLKYDHILEHIQKGNCA